MRCLVTGGAGFIGSHLVEGLISSGHEVVVFDDFSNGSIENLARCKGLRSLKIVKGDINDSKTLKLAMKDSDAVFHNAAIVSVQKSIAEPAFVFHVNVDGTDSVVKCCIDTGVEKLIFASSAAVYGNPQTMPISENERTLPVSPYGQSKLEGERICFEAGASVGLNVAVLRYFNAYGPRAPVSGDYSGVIATFAESLIRSQKLLIFGEGTQTRDFTYVKDIVQANQLALESSLPLRLYNVGSGVETSIERLAKTEKKILAPESRVSLEYRPARQGDIRRSVADISLINEELGYRPHFSLDRGLGEYLEWLNLDPRITVSSTRRSLLSLSPV
jgi:UDP-glucose 4-epimerase